MERRPLVNILVRTSGRPRYYANCIESIIKQTYDNYRVIVSVDDDETQQYVVRTAFAKGDKLRVNRSSHSSDGTFDTTPSVMSVQSYRPEFVRVERKPIDEHDKAVMEKHPGHYYAPYNLYFNKMREYVSDGWIMHLDDDDQFTGPGSLQTIVDHMYTDSAVLFWRVDFGKWLAPSDDCWKRSPLNANVSGIGFAYHSKHRYLAWDQFSMSDRRIMQAAYDALDTHVWINEVLTGVRRKDEFGRGRRDDLPENK